RERTRPRALARARARAYFGLAAGPCRAGPESTIVPPYLEPPLLLRPGGLPREDVEAALGRALEAPGPTDRPSAPGQLKSHYATRTPLRILDGPAGDAPEGRVGLLALRQTTARGYEAVAGLA